MRAIELDPEVVEDGAGSEAELVRSPGERDIGHRAIGDDRPREAPSARMLDERTQQQRDDGVALARLRDPEGARERRSEDAGERDGEQRLAVRSNHDDRDCDADEDVAIPGGGKQLLVRERARVRQQVAAVLEDELGCITNEAAPLVGLHRSERRRHAIDHHAKRRACGGLTRGATHRDVSGRM